MHYFVEGEKIFIDETKRPLGKGVLPKVCGLTNNMK